MNILQSVGESTSNLFSSQKLNLRDNAEKIVLQVISARNLSVMDASSSDPYCIIYCGTHKERTRVIKSSLTPRWDETFVMFAAPDVQFITIEVWDKDLINDDYMGETKIPIPKGPCLGGVPTIKPYSLVAGNDTKAKQKLKAATGELELVISTTGLQPLLRRDVTEANAEETLVEVQSLKELALGPLVPMSDRVVPAITRLGKSFSHFGGRIAMCRGFVWTPATPDRPVPDKDRKSITFSCWFYLNHLPENEHRNLVKHNGWPLLQVRSKQQLYVCGDEKSPSTIPVEKWFHVCVHIAKNTATVWVDAAKTASVAVPVMWEQMADLGPLGFSDVGPYSIAFADFPLIMFGDASSSDVEKLMLFTSPVDVVEKVWLAADTSDNSLFFRCVPPLRTRLMNTLSAIERSSPHELAKRDAREALRVITAALVRTLERGMPAVHGIILPMCVSAATTSAIKPLEVFAEISASWDLGQSVNRYEIPAIAAGLRAAVRGGSAFTSWVYQYIALIKRIPVNYSSSFCPTVIEDLAAICHQRESPTPLVKLTVETIILLSKNSGNKQQFSSILKGDMFQNIMRGVDEKTFEDLFGIIEPKIPTASFTLHKDISKLFLNESEYTASHDLTFQLSSTRESISAHSCIVMARSPYFAELIRAVKSRLGANIHVDLPIADVNRNQMRSILAWMYGAKKQVNFSLSVKETVQVADAAAQFQLHVLSARYLSKLRSQLQSKPESALEYMLSYHAQQQEAAREATNNNNSLSASYPPTYNLCMATLLQSKFANLKSLDLKPLGEDVLATILRHALLDTTPSVAGASIPSSPASSKEKKSDLHASGNRLGLKNDFENAVQRGTFSDFGDFVVRCSADGEFRSYKTILAVRSSFFASLFQTQNVSEYRVDANPAVFTIFWKSLHTDSDAIPDAFSPAQVISLWALCDQLHLTNERLKRSCLLRLKKQSSKEVTLDSADSDSDDF